jgi:hypothetical protein
MNLCFYLQTFILNYSFIVILSDHTFVLCFIKTQPFVKRKPVKMEKKNTGTIAFRFRQVLPYIHSRVDIKTIHATRLLPYIETRSTLPIKGCRFSVSAA